MKEMTINQLLCLTKAEILAIRSYLRAQLTNLPMSSAEYHTVIRTLSNIETVLVRRNLSDIHLELALSCGECGPT